MQSWYEMFLTQPPITEGWAEIHPLIPLVLLRRANGIKLKDLLETVMELSERFEAKSGASGTGVYFSARLNGRGELWNGEREGSGRGSKCEKDHHRPRWLKHVGYPKRGHAIVLWPKESVGEGEPT